MEPLPNRRGNGRRREPSDARRLASMEPLPNRRGNETCTWLRDKNGKLQWSPFRIEGETGHGVDYRREIQQLQWSPFRIEGETTDRDPRRHAANVASMEPLPNRRGNWEPGEHKIWMRPLQWSPFRIEGETCGRCRGLQWSPFRIEGETKDIAFLAGWDAGASMEPLPNRRGNAGRDRVTCRGYGASMEPLPNRRGNSASMVLQGRGGPRLQWSPFRIEGETGSDLLEVLGRLSASMEPLPNRRGNFLWSHLDVFLHHASMEPLPNRRGN